MDICPWTLTFGILEQKMFADDSHTGGTQNSNHNPEGIEPTPTEIYDNPHWHKLISCRYAPEDWRRVRGAGRVMGSYFLLWGRWQGEEFCGQPSPCRVVRFRFNLFIYFTHYLIFPWNIATFTSGFTRSYTRILLYLSVIYLCLSCYS